MIYLKTDEEIELMRISNQIVAKTLAEVCKNIRPGVTTLQLDAIAEAFIRDNGATPTFLGYNGFPNTLCVSVNDVVVHGIPSNYALKEGDVVSVDCGAEVNGFHGDSCYTFCVGEVSEDVKALLRTTKESLYKGIEKAVDGMRLGDVSFAIQSHCEERGYSVVREMVGHGIGKNMHESPEVPNYGKPGNGKKLQDGMVLCIEPMINAGGWEVKVLPDGWTVLTTDGSLSAHYENTVLITDGEPEILTMSDDI